MAFQVNRCRHHTPPVSGGPAVQSIHFKLHVAMVVGVGVTNVHTISLGCTYIYVSVWRHTGNVELEVWIWFKTTDPLLILVSHGFIPKMTISLCVHCYPIKWPPKIRRGESPKALGLHESDAMDFFVSWHGPRMSKASKAISWGFTT